VIVDEAPHISDHLCPDCEAHFEEVKAQLGALGVGYSLNHRLVRGLDYYTRTVFEIQPKREGGQSAIVGGGRYDGLIEAIGGKPTPGVGFAMGLERVILNLKEQERGVPTTTAPRVYLASLGQSARRSAVALGAELRAAGHSVVASTGEKSLKAQLRHANSLGVKYTVILGDDEVRDGRVVVKRMTDNTQSTVERDALREHLAE